MFISAISIILEELVLNGLDPDNVNAAGSLQQQMHSIVEHYQDALCPSTGAFFTNLLVSEPSSYAKNQQAKKRLMGNREKKQCENNKQNLGKGQTGLSRVRPNKSKKSSCTFCGSSEGHQTRNKCEIRRYRT